jgi:hypothetical protein
MRRETSTVVVLAGESEAGMLAELARSPNVTVARAPAAEPPLAGQPAPARPGWEAGALAMREAARRRSTYVIVPEDPLADVAAGWHAMWDVSGAGRAAPPAGSPNGGYQRPLSFEAGAAEALAAWRDKRFDLPDYYLVIAPAENDGAATDLYLGPLRAVRPRRVAVAGAAGAPAQAAQILAALRSLEHGPWWPPLDEVLDAARRFYPGGLAETQLTAP